MRKLKKLAALSIAAAMTFSMAGCGKDDKKDDKTTSDTKATTEGTTEGGNTGEPNLDGGGRTIKIGTWWDMYYGSNDADIYADPSVSDEELAKRREKWQPREPKVTTGYLARYRELVTSGNRGAVLEIPR